MGGFDAQRGAGDSPRARSWLDEVKCLIGFGASTEGSDNKKLNLCSALSPKRAQGASGDVLLSFGMFLAHVK